MKLLSLSLTPTFVSIAQSPPFLEDTLDNYAPRCTMKKNPQVAFGTHTTIITDSNNTSTIAIMLEYDSSSNKLFIKSYAELDTDIPETNFTLSLAYLYITASNLFDIPTDTYFVSTDPSYSLILEQANITSSHSSCYVDILFPAVWH